MHFFSLQLLTALAVFVHLGTAIASMLLKDNTDQKKIEAINTKTDQVLGIVTAIAPAIPTTAPKTITQIASDLATAASALAAATAPATTASAATVGTQTLMGGLGATSAPVTAPTTMP